MRNSNKNTALTHLLPGWSEDRQQADDSWEEVWSRAGRGLQGDTWNRQEMQEYWEKDWPSVCRGNSHILKLEHNYLKKFTSQWIFVSIIYNNCSHWIFLLQVEGISKGHRDKSLHAEAFKTLQKKVKNTNEELQKLLETLDGFTFTEEQLGDETNQNNKHWILKCLKLNLLQSVRLRENQSPLI